MHAGCALHNNSYNHLLYKRPHFNYVPLIRSVFLDSSAYSKLGDLKDYTILPPSIPLHLILTPLTKILKETLHTYVCMYIIFLRETYYIHYMYFTDDLVFKLPSVIDEYKASRFMDEVCLLSL